MGVHDLKLFPNYIAEDGAARGSCIPRLA